MYIKRRFRGFYLILTIRYMKMVSMVATSFCADDSMKQFPGLIGQLLIGFFYNDPVHYFLSSWSFSSQFSSYCRPSLGRTRPLLLAKPRCTANAVLGSRHLSMILHSHISRYRRYATSVRGHPNNVSISHGAWSK